MDPEEKKSPIDQVNEAAQATGFTQPAPAKFSSLEGVKIPKKPQPPEFIAEKNRQKALRKKRRKESKKGKRRS